MGSGFSERSSGPRKDGLYTSTSLPTSVLNSASATNQRSIYTIEATTVVALVKVFKNHG